MSSDDIEALYESCEYKLGNVVAWPDFKGELRGRITVRFSGVIAGVVRYTGVILRKN